MSESKGMLRIELGEAQKTIRDVLRKAIELDIDPSRWERVRDWIVRMWKAIRRMVRSPFISGIQFVTKGGIELEVFVGMEMHVSHEGECLADMKCKLGEIQKIETSYGCVNLTMADHTFSFIGVELRTIHKTKVGK